MRLEKSGKRPCRAITAEEIESIALRNTEFNAFTDRHYWRSIAQTFLSGTSYGVTTRTETEIIDVSLRDGRLISVERTFHLTTLFRIADPFFGLPVLPRLETGPVMISLKFSHPDTKEDIIWKGEPHFRPVLLDFLGGVPYLVLNGFTSKDAQPVYGCPDLPYYYLKYTKYEFSTIGSWVPLPVERAPTELREANLLDAHPSNDAGFFQRRIPRTYAEWNYLYKDSHLNDRKQGDCRPPRASLPQVSLPPATKAIAEVIEINNYSPNRFVGEDWSSLVFDKKREPKCKDLFTVADPNDSMQGQRFVNDRTGKRAAPYSTRAQFNMGVRVLCDEFIWFITHMEEPGNIIISKFTTTGDLLYRFTFKNPDPVDGFTGYIRVPSLRTDNGYLYFDWLHFREVNRHWEISRSLSMRVREPD
ncbi:MAG: hypothetical protein ACKVQA_13610, partial [Burkholderiales bacterium]